MSTTNTHHRPARIGTIVWGAILVGIAVLTLLLVFGGPLSAAAVLWSVVGFGALLVVAAIVAGVVRAVRNRTVVVAEPTEEHPPIG